MTNSQGADGVKRVLLIIIDALATRIVGPALEAGKLSNLARIADAGGFHPECLSIFPSITPAATGSIVSGAYPFEHGISGAYWYDADKDDVAYFGDDLMAIYNQGLDHYLNDFQVRLNVDRLRIPTIFERIEQHGRLRDAVVNFLWYRGTVEHAVSVPMLLKITPGMSFVETMRGPHQMFVGDFVASKLDGKRPSARGGVTRRFGFHDETTADYLLELARSGPLPEFTLAYFPNNDFDSHANGPANALETLEAVDGWLGELFEIVGGLEKFLSESAVLITGDHSQSDLDDEAMIDLNDLLKDFQLVEAGRPWRNSEDLMACPNLRAAQIYLREDLSARRQEVIDSLLDADEIDQVIWCDSDGGLNRDTGAVFRVKTRERGELSFHAAETGKGRGEDDFGTSWSWDGDLSAVDAQVAGRKIQFGDYPNAFERIAAAFFDETANLWVTARLGKEFCLPETGVNPKGSHGSLHRDDSTAPLIVAGCSDLPEKLRIVDLMPICLQILGVDPPRPAGASHILNRL